MRIIAQELRLNEVTKRDVMTTPEEAKLIVDQAFDRGQTVAILVPCYNEEITVGKVVDDFKRVIPRADVYVYDNNSKDRTSEIARDHGAIVRFEGRQGKGNVVRQMFREIEADYYVMVDGDDTYPAEAVYELVAPLVQERADMTVGDRLSNGSYGEENDRAFHGFGNDLVRFLIKLIYGFAFEDVMTGYRAFNRVFVKTMPVQSAGFQIETELSIHAVDKRWRVVDVPIDYRDRPEGSESKLSTFSDGARVLMAIGGLFKDSKPLAFFSLIALIFLVVALIFGVPVLVEYFTTHLVPRIPTVMLTVGLGLCALLFFINGLILDTVAKNNRKSYEMEVMRVYSEQGRR